MMKKYEKGQIKDVGQNYQKARISNGITQEEVAELIGLSPFYISDIERGKTFGSIHTLISLCNFYKVTPNDILYPLLDFKIESTEPSISGFNALNSCNKEVIIEMIRVLNEKQ